MISINYKKFFWIDYAFLRTVGIWVGDDSEIKPKWYPWFTKWTFFMIITYNMSLTTYWIQCANIKAAAFSGYAETITVMNLVKIFILLKNKADLVSNIKLFDNEYFQVEDQEEFELVEKKLRKYRKVTRVYSIVVWIWLSLVIFAPLFSETLDGLVLPAYFPFNISSFPGFHVAYGSQVISIILAGLITSHTDIYLAASCTFIGLQCTLLSMRLLKIGNNGCKHRDSFLRCLKQYQSILRFYETTTKVFGKIYFWQLFSSTTSLSMILFLLSLAKPGSYEWFTLFTGTCSVCAILLVPCTFASEMTRKSEVISTSAFHSNWADSNSNAFTKDVMFFMCKTQEPLKFKATWVFDISKTTYVSVLRAAMSYYTVLSNMNLSQEY